MMIFSKPVYVTTSWVDREITLSPVFYIERFGGIGIAFTYFLDMEMTNISLLKMTL